MPAAEIQSLDVQFSRDLIQYWGWFLALGVGLLALGVAAVARAVTATVASMLFFGWLLVLAAGDLECRAREGPRQVGTVDADTKRMLDAKPDLRSRGD